MRLLLIAFLVCLLPMRGWTATAMAMSMATAQVATAKTHGAASLDGIDLSEASTMAAECPMHIEASGAPANAADKNSSPACSGCDTCELCLAMASFAAPQFLATPFSHSGTPAALHHGFVSADRASRLKPPIS